MKKKSGSENPQVIDLYLSHELFNTVISMLSMFMLTSESNPYAIFAEKLYKKIMNYGRYFLNNGEENVAVHLYENESALLIKLFAIYVNAIETPNNDYFEEFKINRKNNIKL